MKQKTFPGITPAMTEEQRIAFLEAHSEGIEEQTYVYYYSEEESKALHTELPKQLNQIRGKKLEQKKVIKAQKDVLKAMEAEQEKLSDNLLNGYEERKNDLFKMNDHENLRVQYVDENGVIVKERAMTPQERQLQISETRHVKMAN